MERERRQALSKEERENEEKSAVMPTRDGLVCALWPSGTKGLILMASFTTIRFSIMDWGCSWVFYRIV